MKGMPKGICRLECTSMLFLTSGLNRLTLKHGVTFKAHVGHSNWEQSGYGGSPSSVVLVASPAGDSIRVENSVGGKADRSLSSRACPLAWRMWLTVASRLRDWDQRGKGRRVSPNCWEAASPMKLPFGRMRGMCQTKHRLLQFNIFFAVTYWSQGHRL